MKKTIANMIAAPATPPTTPPIIAPVWVDEPSVSLDGLGWVSVELVVAFWTKSDFKAGSAHADG